jgi:ribosomal protein L40E
MGEHDSTVPQLYVCRCGRAKPMWAAQCRDCTRQWTARVMSTPIDLDLKPYRPGDRR